MVLIYAVIGKNVVVKLFFFIAPISSISIKKILKVILTDAEGVFVTVLPSLPIKFGYCNRIFFCKLLHNSEVFFPRNRQSRIGCFLLF